ncbi:MAG: glycosyltransferase [Deltaproteobacteria bacterium]|nr:glycosyltransferase [Deltaproteobacteria bacterium]
MSKVSLISTVYNGELYIDDLLRNISEQTLTEFEYLIVDDGSTDNSVNKIKDLQSRYPFVRLLLAGRVGRVKALNLAVANASGEYIANLDIDDLIYETRLQLQSEYLDAHPSVGVLGGAYVINQQIRQERIIRKPPLTHVELKKQLIRLVPFSHSVVMFRKEAWQKVGGYKEVANEDLYLWFEMVKGGWQLAALPQVIGEHRKHQNSYWHKNFSYLKRQYELACLQAQIAKKLCCPYYERFIPFGRIVYALQPTFLKTIIRKQGFRINEEKIAT